jgi:hypothetical protein
MIMFIHVSLQQLTLEKGSCLNNYKQGGSFTNFMMRGPL